MKINNINEKLKKFKKRQNSLNYFSFLKLNFGLFGLFFKKNCNFEFIYITFFKKFLKFFKKSYINKIQKIWFLILKNYPISFKSKNSRMGKGKGDFLR